jgi:hypothetical protein
MVVSATLARACPWSSSSARHRVCTCLPTRPRSLVVTPATAHTRRRAHHPCSPAIALLPPPPGPCSPAITRTHCRASLRTRPLSMLARRLLLPVEPTVCARPSRPLSTSARHHTRPLPALTCISPFAEEECEGVRRKRAERFLMVR